MLLAGTACVVFALMADAGLRPAWADGGAGSSGGGGAGGIDHETGPGGNGGAALPQGYGGGGGGTGAVGGHGSQGDASVVGGTGGAGGLGGAIAGADGLDGQAGDGPRGGGGGGGGAHGYIGAFTPITPNISGGHGGNGGDNLYSGSGGGGGGGAGGYGAVITGAGSLDPLQAGLLGGDGGNGGQQSNASGMFLAGNGGSGGIGLRLTSVATKAIYINNNITGGKGGAAGNNWFSAPSVWAKGGDGGIGIRADNTTLTINSNVMVKGGDGGTRDSWDTSGTANDGLGGAGIVGSDLEIIQRGWISGGLSGNGTRANALTFTGGTNSLMLSNSQTGPTGNIALNGGASLTLDQPVGFNTVLNDSITGNGSLIIGSGGNVIRLAGANTYTGGTTIWRGTLRAEASGAFVDNTAYSLTGGTLDLNGHDLTMSSLSGSGGEIALGAGQLTVNQSTDTAYGGGIGAGDVIKAGTGTLLLTGQNRWRTGTTSVLAGTLLIGNGANLTWGGDTWGGPVYIGASGTLGGSGIVAGDVTVDGTLSAGNSPGTLKIDGSLTLKSGSKSVFELNTPGVAGGTDNDLVNVGGTLTLGGTLEAYVAAAGYYRLFNYGTAAGTFSTENVASTHGGFKVGSHGVGFDTAGQINLSVLADGQTMQFWDGSATTSNSVVDGGGGFWSNTGTNWTDKTGSYNGRWAGSVGVFAGQAGGDVYLLGAQSFDTLQFSTDGYRLVFDPLAIGMAGGSVLNVDSGVSATILSVIEDGVGSALTKAGGGTLVLSGQNTYTGGTTLRGGVLEISENANLGAATGVVTFDGGTLKVVDTLLLSRDMVLAAGGGTIDTVYAVLHAGDISGAGALTLTGGGDFTFLGDNTLTGSINVLNGSMTTTSANGFSAGASYNLAAGTDLRILPGLHVTIGSLSGSGTVSLDGAMSADSSLTTGGDNTDTAFSGVIEGDGYLAKTGSGTFTLSGTNTYTGNTTVSGGRLVVNGSIASSQMTSVLAGASLGGTGTLGHTTIAAGGTHAPGNSIGTQTVAGNYVNHGTLQIEANPTAADKLVVSGGVDISGATLDLLLSPPTTAGWSPFAGPFTIIDKQSAGAVTGTFSAINNALLFLDPTIDYTGGNGNDVTLSLTRNTIAFASLGQTFNQIATAESIETLPNTNPVWNAITLTTDADAARSAFDLLSGEIHASAKTALIEDSRFVREAAAARIRAAFEGVGAVSSPVLAYGPDGQELAAAATESAAAWGSVFGAWGSNDGNGNVAGFDRAAGGFFTGLDGFVTENMRLGILTSYSHSSFDADDRASSGSSDNYHLGLYGGTQMGALGLRAGAAYSWHDVDTARSVVFPGFADSLTASYDAGTFQAFGEAGYRIDTASVAFEPFANLAYVNLHSDGFAETGGAAALTSASQTTDATFTTLGVRASTAFDLGNARATARGMLGWKHAFGDVVPLATHAFAGSNAFTVAGAPIARNAAIIETGLDFDIAPMAKLDVSYNGEIASKARDHGFKADLSVRF